MSQDIMAHLVASFPNWEGSLDVGKGLIDGGASFIEIQFPFSDPTADEPHIQMACDRAIDSGFAIEAGFNLVEALRNYSEVPIAVMSYANLIYQNGVNNFVKSCKASGANAIIAPDLPPDYDEGLYEEGVQNEIKIIPVIVPSTPIRRLKMLMQKSNTDLIYTGLRKGVTGNYTEIGKENTLFLQSIVDLGGKPLAGFGIRNHNQVRALSPYVKYIVVGTLFVQKLCEYPEFEPQEIMRKTISSLLIPKRLEN